KRIASTGLHWELLRENWQYSWYSISGSWRHRVQRRDQPIETGALDIAGDTPAALSRNLPAGRYRWEVSDPASGAQSSLRFHVGWQVEAALPDVPDKLEVALDRPSYQLGETAKLFVKAPFAGEAELAIGSNQILALRSFNLPAGGTTIELPVDVGWGTGIYALVSAYRPQAAPTPGPGPSAPRGPGRAVGVVWLGIDASPRTLSVALAAPDVVRPRGAAEIGVKISGLAAGEEAYVTLAAVDQAVLKLTEFDSPAPRLGAASGAMIVRDPVVTMVSLPRFLAPGDNGQIGVVINNLEGGAGEYRLKLAASGAGNFAAPAERTIPLAAGAGFSGSFQLSATTIGNVALRLDLDGPGDLRIARDFTVGVRPAQAYQLRRFVGRLEPGQSVTLDDGGADEFLPGTAEALLSVSPRPDWDMPGLLRALDRYAYGCLEQTTSRALPLLYVEAVAGLWRTDPGFAPGEVIDRAIGHVVELQRSDGSFGVWNETDDTVPWLDAYATDFLMRAKEHGRNVPDYAVKSALGWLRDYVRQDRTEAKDLPALAYAHYVLARGKAGDLAVLR